MSKTWKILGRLAAASALAGIAACAAPIAKPPSGAMSETTPRTPTVTLVKLTHNVRFQPGQFAPDADQESGLAKFLGDSEARRGDSVTILRGPSLADRDRAARLSQVLASRGMLSSVVTDNALAAGELKVVYDRYVVHPPRCPDWSQPNGDKLTNELPSDFGCSSSANLAAMVADPHDLVVGHTMGPIVGDAATRPVARYRDGAIPALSSASSSSGSGSGSSSSSGSGSGSGSSGP
jgi:pilus assembly protein CpaD